MKRVLLATMFCLMACVGAFAQMSDTQVLAFIASESKAGRSQSQIVTSLMQRGVQIEQIRRIRNQYDAQIKIEGSRQPQMVRYQWRPTACRAMEMVRFPRK